MSIRIFGAHLPCGHPRQIDDGEVLPCAVEFSHKIGPRLRYRHPLDEPKSRIAFDDPGPFVPLMIKVHIREYQTAMVNGRTVRPERWERTI